MANTPTIRKSSTVNSVTLLGRLGGDPEFTTTPGGHALAKFSVATDRYMGPNREPETDWHNIVCWNDQAQSVHGYLHKGDQVYIEGNLHQSQWQPGPGIYRERTEVYGTRVTFLRKAPVMAPAKEEPEPVAAD